MRPDNNRKPIRNLRILTLFSALLLPAQAMAAGGEMPSLVLDIGYSILLAGLLSVVFIRLRIPEIAAFLAAGLVAGPIGAGLVTDVANIDTIAQLGLILLLFVIGLEIDMGKLLSSGRVLIISGLLQYPLCVLLGFLLIKLLVWLGISGELLASSGYAPLYVGFMLAASSTLLVVKLFQETFQLDTEVGRIALGLLIFQDIWAIVVIALQPNFDNPQIGPILLSFAGIGLLAAIAVLLARYVAPIGFRWIAKMPEIILVVALSWCFLVVFLGLNLDRISEGLFGINLHLAVSSGMGALIAGASVASLPYANEIIGKVGTVKDFFITLFFVGLGMGIPKPDGLDVVLLAVLFAVLALLARYLVFLPLLYLTGLDRRCATVASTRLAQVSEFSLVIAFLGLQLGHISPGLNSAVIFAFVITALLTPALYHKADNLHERVGPLLERLGFKSPAVQQEEEQTTYAIAILGFHRIASSLLYQLARSQPELLPQTLVVDFNVGIHSRIEEYGVTARYGDLQNDETLHHAGIDKARVVVCTIPDDVLKGTSNRKLVAAVRHMNPTAIIIANAIELREIVEIYAAGADYVFMQRMESARAVENAIEIALNGDIAAYRSRQDKAEGIWSERREVLD